MSKWPIVKLGEVCQFINGDRGKNYPSGKDFVESGIPFINAGHLENRDIIFDDMNYITSEKYSKLGSGKITAGDVLYCLRGSLGKHALVTINKGAIASSLLILRPKDRLNNRYLLYCLDSSSIKKQQDTANNGSSQPNLSAASVKNYAIPLPSLEEQKRIAAMLDKARSLIDLRKKQIAEMDALVKAKFIEMFGDPLINLKRWDTKQLKELGEWASGSTPSRGESNYFTGNINWFTAGELNSLYLTDSIEKITDEAVENSSTKIFKKGSMFIGMYDTAAFKMGVLQHDAAANQACANICPNNIVNILWLYFILTIMKPHFLENRRGIRQKNLNLGMIKNFEIPLPPFDLQNEFARFVQQTDKSKLAKQKSLEQMETLYNALMQQSFS